MNSACRAGLFRGEFGDEPRAGGLVRRVGNLRVARREELLFLQLDAFPRRIAEHDVEPAPAAKTSGNSSGQ